MALWCNPFGADLTQTLRKSALSLVLLGHIEGHIEEKI